MTAPLTGIQGRELARFVKSLAIARGDPVGAEAYAQGQGWTTTAAVLKAVIDPMQSAVANDNAMRPVANDLATMLRSMTIVGRLAGTRRVPFATRLLTQTIGGTGAWVGEGKPIPVSAGAFEQTATLDQKRVAGIRVLTADLMRNLSGAADAAVALDVAEGPRVALDLAFIDPANGGTSDKPAAVTYGAPAFSSSGATVAAIDADLQRLVNSLTDAQMPLTTAAWVMAPRSATTLSLARGSSGAPAYPGMTARGGTLLGLPVLTSTVVAASGSPGERFVALLEADEILVADEGAAAIDLSEQAAVQMNDAPATGAQQLVSLWQHGMVGIRAQRFVNWRRRRTSAVAVLRDVSW